MPNTITLSDLFAQPVEGKHGPLTDSHLYKGAAFVEPPRYDRPARMSYVWGQLCFLCDEPDEIASASFITAAGNGYDMERLDAQAAIHALICQAARQGKRS